MTRIAPPDGGAPKIRFFVRSSIRFSRCSPACFTRSEACFQTSGLPFLRETAIEYITCLERTSQGKVGEKSRLHIPDKTVSPAFLHPTRCWGTQRSRHKMHRAGSHEPKGDTPLLVPPRPRSPPELKRTKRGVSPFGPFRGWMIGGN